MDSHSIAWSHCSLSRDACGCVLQVADEAKRDELAGLFGLTEEDKLDVATSSDKESDKAKQEQEDDTFF